MIKKRIEIIMSEELLEQPFLYRLVKDHDLVPGVRGATVKNKEACMQIELQGGSEEQINGGIDYLLELGVTVKSLEGDFVES